MFEEFIFKVIQILYVKCVTSALFKASGCEGDDPVFRAAVGPTVVGDAISDIAATVDAATQVAGTPGPVKTDSAVAVSAASPILFSI